MKKIELKETSVTNSQMMENQRLNYRNEFLAVCEISAQGLTIAEMSLAVGIAEKLRAAEGAEFVLLEDAEHDWLTKQIRARRFNILCRELIDMVTSLEGAPKVEVSAT